MWTSGDARGLHWIESATEQRGRHRSKRGPDALIELTTPTVIGYLCRRGVLPHEKGASVEVLGGGVSNGVWRVDSPDGSFVVKQARGKLRVADDWTANRERTLTEGEALQVVASVTPGLVPAVVDVDADAVVLITRAAPAQWRDWKTILLATGDHGHDRSADADASAEREASTAHEVGSALAAWHGATTGERLAGTRMDDPQTFEQLRVDPYHRTVMHRYPDVAGLVADVVDDMASRRVCLVHGDLSPKNVLVAADPPTAHSVGARGLWVIDFEVAHWGEPRFDLAFLLSHLLMKSVHQPRRSSVHRAAGAAFLDAYERGRTGRGVEQVVDGVLSAHVGCLLLARVYGKSPAEYLTGDEPRSVAAVGEWLLRARPLDPLDGWGAIPTGVVGRP